MNFMTSDEMNALCSGRFQGDPFSVLGMHLCSKNILTPFLYVRTFQPQAQKVELVRVATKEAVEMKKILDSKETESFSRNFTPASTSCFLYSSYGKS